MELWGDSVRKVISPNKVSADGWIEVMETGLVLISWDLVVFFPYLCDFIIL